METIKKERYIEMKMLMQISMNTLMHISRWILLRMMLRGKVCNARLDCYVIFQEENGEYCLQQEKTMVQDRKWKSNAASLGLWNNYGTSPLIFRAATFLLAKSSQVLKCWGVAGAWCDRRISLMSVWLWELFENLFTFVAPEVEKPKESIRVEVRWGRDVPGVVRFHHLLSATGPLRPSVHRPPFLRTPSTVRFSTTVAPCQPNQPERCVGRILVLGPKNSVRISLKWRFS